LRGGVPSATIARQVERELTSEAAEAADPPAAAPAEAAGLPVQLTPAAAVALQRRAGNRATRRLVRRHLQRAGDVVTVELASQPDAYTDRKTGQVVRIGDAHGPMVLTDILEIGGTPRLTWFNFHTGQAETGTLDTWNFLSMVDIAGTADSQRFGRLGKELTPAEWRRSARNPVKDVLAHYEAGSKAIADEVVTTAYRGMVAQAALERLRENEAKIDALLSDDGKVARLEEYAHGLKEAGIVRDALMARKRDVDRSVSLSEQAPTIGLPKRANIIGLDMPQRIRAIQEQAQLQEAIDFWTAAFPLLTRVATADINAGRVEDVLRQIKSNLVATRADLVGGPGHHATLDPWTLAPIRAEVDQRLGTRARAAVEEEDKQRRRWAWVKAGASLAAGIGLLFVPGGVFIDVAIGAAMAGEAWADAAQAGRAANSGLGVDDGLMTQAQAARARTGAILSTIFAVVGAAAAGFGVVRNVRAFMALGEALPGLEMAGRLRLARLLSRDPELIQQLGRLAARDEKVLGAVREAMQEFPGDAFRLRQAVRAIAEGYTGPIRQAWMHGLHADAIAALKRATPEELEAIEQMTRSARGRQDVNELLRQLTYKGRKAERAGGPAFEGVADAAGRLKSSLAELAAVRGRGFPYGFSTLAAFRNFGRTLRDGLKRWGVDVADIRVQGSALHNRAPGDIDVAVIADAAQFDALAARFAEVARSAGNTKLARTIAKEAADGKLPWNRFGPREAGFDLMRVVRGAAGDQKVQVSLIKRGSDFDLGPFHPVP